MNSSKSRVFLSWSGNRAKAIAQAFNTWIPSVIQNASTYFSPEDIQKGSRWGEEISQELQKSSRGIFIMTEFNVNSPWMIFEAGALSKEVGNSKICPILFGLQETDIVGPLSQFQSLVFRKEELNKLIKQLNDDLGDSGIEIERLNDTFEKWWPDLEMKVKAAMNVAEKEGKDSNIDRSEKELIREVLLIVRSSTFQSYMHGIGPDQAAVEKLIYLYSDLLSQINNKYLGDDIADLIIQLDPPLARLLVQCRYASTPWGEMRSTMAKTIRSMSPDLIRKLNNVTSGGSKLLEDEAFGIDIS